MFCIIQGQVGACSQAIPYSSQRGPNRPRFLLAPLGLVERVYYAIYLDKTRA